MFFKHTLLACPVFVRGYDPMRGVICPLRVIAARSCRPIWWPQYDCLEGEDTLIEKHAAYHVDVREGHDLMFNVETTCPRFHMQLATSL